MLDRINFILGEAFIALRRNSLMSLAAITTVAVSLFILGGLGFTYYRLSEFARSLPQQLDLRVYLVDGATTTQVKGVLARIRQVPSVQQAIWIPADRAWQQFLRDNPEPAYREFGNVYPEAIKVVWKDLSRASMDAKLIASFPAVASVDQPESEQKVVAQAMRLIQGVGVGLGGILFLTGGILIYNAIRLTIISRRREIRIMQLVGASRLTIQLPFIIEGIVQGILGGVLAWMILLGTHTAFSRFVSELRLNLSLDLPWQVIVPLLCGAGAAYGLVCSILAVREPTRFR